MDEPVWMPAVRYVMARCGEKVDVAKLDCRSSDEKRDSVRLLVDFRSFFRRTLDALSLFRTRGSTLEFCELFKESVVDLLDAGMQLVFVLPGIKRNDALERHLRERKWKAGRREVRRMFSEGARRSSDHASASTSTTKTSCDVAMSSKDVAMSSNAEKKKPEGGGERVSSSAAAMSSEGALVVQVVDRLWQRVALQALRSLSKQFPSGSLIVLRMMDAEIDYESLARSMNAFAVLTDDIRLIFRPHTPLMLLSSLDYSAYESGHFWASLIRPSAFAGALNEIARSMASEDTVRGSFTLEMLPDLGVLLGVSSRLPERRMRAFASRIMPLARRTPFQLLAAAVLWLSSCCAPGGQLTGSKIAEVFGAEADSGDASSLLNPYLEARCELAGGQALPAGSDADVEQRVLLIKQEVVKRQGELHGRLRKVSEQCNVDIWEEYVKGCLSVDMLRLCIHGTLPFDNRLEPSTAFDMDGRCSILIGRRLAAALGLREAEWYSWEALKLMHTRDSDIQSSGLWGSRERDAVGGHRIYSVLGLQALDARLGEGPHLTLGQLAVCLLQTIFPETSSAHLSLLQAYFASRAQCELDEKALLTRMKAAPAVESLSVVYLVSGLEICLEWIVNVNDVFACALYSRDVVAEQLLHFDPYDLTCYVEAQLARAAEESARIQ